MLITFIILYLLLTLFVGKYASKFITTSQDFAIAGKRLPTYMVASGLFATWFGSETVMGASTEFLENGLLGIIEDPFGASLCLFLLGIFFAKPLYKLNILTFSDYFSNRYSKKVEIISAFFMIPSYFGWIAAQLVAMAIILQSIANVPFTIGIIFCSAIVLFYTYLGGMWSVSITDTVQTIVIIIGLLYILVSMVYQISDLSAFYKQLPSTYFQFTPQKNTTHNWLLYFSAWITIGWGSIPQQDVFQRVLAAKNEKTAVWGSIISAFMYLTIAFIPILIVIVGKYLYKNIEVENSQMTLPHLILSHGTILTQILFFGALLSAILSTCSGAVLAPSTVIAENILKPIYGDKISDKQLLKLMRFSVVIISVFSIIMALQKANIYELVGESSALSLVALFVPLVGGLYCKNCTTNGATLSMFLGTFSWVYLNFYTENELAMLIGLIFSIAGMIFGSLYDKLKEKI